MKFLEKLPLPLSGTMLGCAALGNLLDRPALFGVIAAILWLLLVLKLIFAPKSVSAELHNPVVASVAPTFSMATIILSGSLLATDVSALAPVAFAVWLAGIVLHVALIVFYTRRFLFMFDLKQLFPSTLIVYVGIVVATLTAPAFARAGYGALARPLGVAAFWFGLASLLVLLVPLLYRTLIIRNIPRPALSTTAVFAAPVALCAAGYLSLLNAGVFKPQTAILWVFLICVLIAWLTVLGYLLVKLLWLPFYPSCSSFTFPLVISAIAVKGLTSGPLKAAGVTSPALSVLVTIMAALATIIVIYVLIRYLLYLVDLFIQREQLG